MTSNEERNRTWRLLIDEIRFQQKSRQLWEEHPTASENIKKDQLFGFDCQISALAVFGSKVFGIKKEEIIKEAEKG